MTFRAHLQREFDRRRAINRRYSLRSFARWLSIDHASLSQILRGTRRAGVRAMNDLASRLQIDASRLAKYRDVEVEDAVLQAIRRPDFEPSSRWLATRVGINIDEVNIALQRLLRKEKLRMAGGNEWLIR
jgi:transcriptional regulator with XRE-family HTH domain